MITLREWQFGVRDLDSLEETTLQEAHSDETDASFEQLLKTVMFRSSHEEQFLPNLMHHPQHFNRFLAMCHEVTDNVDEVANILGIPVARIEEAATEESVRECGTNEYYHFPINEHTEAFFRLESRFAEEVIEAPA